MTSPHVCILIERYLVLGCKNPWAMIWPRIHVTLPIFVSSRGLTVVWESYNVVIGIIHLGECLTGGHCRAVFFHSGIQLIVKDDFDLPHIMPRTDTFCTNHISWQDLEPPSAIENNRLTGSHRGSTCQLKTFHNYSARHFWLHHSFSQMEASAVPEAARSLLRCVSRGPTRASYTFAEC